MVALWENPTIWLSQERQENLCIFVWSVWRHMETPVHVPRCVAVCAAVCTGRHACLCSVCSAHPGVQRAVCICVHVPDLRACAVCLHPWGPCVCCHKPLAPVIDLQLLGRRVKLGCVQDGSASPPLYRVLFTGQGGGVGAYMHGWDSGGLDKYRWPAELWLSGIGETSVRPWVENGRSVLVSWTVNF